MTFEFLGFINVWLPKNIWLGFSGSCTKKCQSINYKLVLFVKQRLSVSHVKKRVKKPSFDGREYSRKHRFFTREKTGVSHPKHQRISVLGARD
ncbi:MAG: hypothetical protein C5B59_20905 [Bacteroidetes bacterium]|nr:MAG: hypothetical protein C5B59_20905 [Bacteroidota bacterium]